MALHQNIVVICLAMFITKGEGRIEGGLKNVGNIPLDDNQIYKIHTRTYEQCVYVCINTVECQLALFKESTSQCFGYSSADVLEDELGQDGKACSLYYKGCSSLAPCLNGGTCIAESGLSRCACPYGYGGDYCQTAEKVNLALHPDTSCFACSEYSSHFHCDNVYDGITDPSIAESEWASGIAGDVGAWISIIFPKCVVLEEIEVWPRCGLDTQAKLLRFDLSDGFSFQGNGICDGSDWYTNCDGQARFSRFDISPARETESLNITALQICYVTDSSYFGFIEVKPIGHFC